MDNQEEAKLKKRFESDKKELIKELRIVSGRYVGNVTLGLETVLACLYQLDYPHYHTNIHTLLDLWDDVGFATVVEGLELDNLKQTKLLVELYRIFISAPKYYGYYRKK